ncbi:MAG: cohesin domain-containing protein [Oscillospiraceae bacterium]|nr:cohesin domain-containing protein [Oscillospiraceae bacterium]
MKKKLSVLVIIILVLVFTMNITSVLSMSSFTIGLSASSTTAVKGQTVDVTVSLRNFVSVGSGPDGINAIKLTIDYDKTVFNALQTTDITSNGSWSAVAFDPTQNLMATDRAKLIAVDSDLLTIRFTVKDTATLGNTTITVKNVDAGDSVNDIYPQNQSITLNVIPATSFNVNLSATSTVVETGQTVDATVSLKDFPVGCKGTNVLALTIDYDQAVFNTLSVADLTAIGGWKPTTGQVTFNPANGKVALENPEFISVNQDFLTIRFTVKSTATLGNTTITVKNIGGSDEVNNISTADQSVKLNIIPMTDCTMALSATALKAGTGKVVNTTVSVKDFPTGCVGINSAKLTINYDQTVFNTLSTSDLTTQGGWTVVSFDSANGSIKLSNTKFVSTNQDLLTIKFTVKNTATLGNTTITGKDIIADNGTDSISFANPITTTLTVVGPPPLDGYIRVWPNTTVEDFKKLDGKSDFSGFKTEQGTPLANTDYIPVGATATDGIYSYTLIVVGDINADGKLTVTDLSQIKMFEINSLKILTDTQKMAADVKWDDLLTIIDVSRIKMIMVGLGGFDIANWEPVSQPGVKRSDNKYVISPASPTISALQFDNTHLTPYTPQP